MRVFKGLVAAVLLAGSFAANAVPTVWIDYRDFNPDRYISPGPGNGHSYDHNINDNGFDVGTDWVLGYELLVDLYDDGNDPRKHTAEIAFLNQPGWLGDQLFFNVSGAEFGGWSLAGVAQLFLTGYLSLQITSWEGDFYLGSSTLIAYGEDFSTSVPEPTTLSLLGLGLLGLGFAARRRRT